MWRVSSHRTSTHHPTTRHYLTLCRASSLLTQHYRILQLQQNEVILTHRTGGLESQVKLTQTLLDNAKREIEELKLKLSVEKVTVTVCGPVGGVS